MPRHVKSIMTAVIVSMSITTSSGHAFTKTKDASHGSSLVEKQILFTLVRLVIELDFEN